MKFKIGDPVIVPYVLIMTSDGHVQKNVHGTVKSYDDNLGLYRVEYDEPIKAFEGTAYMSSSLYSESQLILNLSKIRNDKLKNLLKDEI
jgi:hypothetical protein